MKPKLKFFKTFSSVDYVCKYTKISVYSYAQIKNMFASIYNLFGAMLKSFVLPGSPARGFSIRILQFG
jgi:hypothetical protein